MTAGDDARATAAAIAEFRTELRGVGREIGQLRAANTDMLKQLAVVSTRCAELAAKTAALIDVSRENIDKLFSLDGERSRKIQEMEVADQQRLVGLVTRKEHEELRKQVEGINLRLAKVIAIASVASSVLTAIAQPIFSGLFKGLFQ